VFPPIYVALVRVGRASGRSTMSLSAGDERERAAAVRQRAAMPLARSLLMYLGHAADLGRDHEPAWRA